MSTTPLTVLIVSNDFYSTEALIAEIRSQFGEAVVVQTAYRDYHFSLEGIDILMGNGLVKTRRSDVHPTSIYFPEARTAAKHKGIPYVSTANPISRISDLLGSGRLIPANTKTIIKKLDKIIEKQRKQKEQLVTQ